MLHIWNECDTIILRAGGDNLNCNKIKGKMRELEYTQDKLAKEMDITVQTLNAKLNGRSDFTLKELLKLKDILGGEVLKDFF